MRNWSAFRLTLALTPLNAVLFFNSTLVLFQREFCLKWLKVIQDTQNSCLRISQVNTSTVFSENPCNITIISNLSNFYTTSDLKYSYIKHFNFWNILCHFIVLQENRIPLSSSSNILNCTTIILLKTINNFHFLRREGNRNMTTQPWS